MTQHIEVRMAKSKAEDNPIFANMRVINELRQAGVPVLGATVLQGVSHGTLGVWFDSKTQEHVYAWSEHQPKAEADPLNSDDEDDEL